MNNTGSVSTLDGNTFVVSDTAGDIDASPNEPNGLFSWDTRYLSRWTLTLNGSRLTPLSTDDLHYFETRFFLVPGTGTVYVDATLSVIRRRAVVDGFREEITILNHSDNPVDLTLRLDAAADFADLFEVKDHLKKKGKYYTRVDNRLLLGYERQTYRRETLITPTTPTHVAHSGHTEDAPTADIDDTGLTFTIHLDGHGSWNTEVHVMCSLWGWAANQRITAHNQSQHTRRDMETDLAEWIAAAPKLECDWEPLKHTYRRSLTDLAALRFAPMTSGERSLPAAGLPWFMTMFGRDSILTSLQALPFVPSLAATTLQELGARQGSRTDDFRDEDPGRILHEMRYGELTAFEERPHSPYYGSADSTPLFLILLDEYERWSGNTRLVRDLEYEARAAIDWIDHHADLRGDGYIWYQTRNPDTGLENQCWKDSWDSISYRDGRLPGFPRATCELQGYAYDAKIRTARLARTIWKDPAWADELEQQAADLKTRFNRDFWIEDGHYYALALDEDGNHVDALSSNIGHLLWSGIVERRRAKHIVDHLLGPRLYSGWGIRTLAEGQARYNPVGYHVGTVWPFDNSFIAWGLRRYGYKQEAARVAASILDAAEYFDGRLPEAFCGYHRALTKYPVPYPTACSPQAWSTGTPLLLLGTMLGLQAVDDHLVVDPALPVGIGHLALLDVPGRWGHRDAYGRGRVQVRAEDRRKLRPQLSTLETIIERREN